MATTLLLLLCFSAVCLTESAKNGTLTRSSSLAARERIRRLIPYMTFYLAQPAPPNYRQQSAAGQAPQPASSTSNRWPYPPPHPVHYAVPLAVSPYRSSYGGNRYVNPQSLPLSRLISQNYLSIAKQQGKLPLRAVYTSELGRPSVQYATPMPQHDVNQEPPEVITESPQASYKSEHLQNQYPQDDYDELQYKPQPSTEGGFQPIQYKPMADIIFKQQTKPQIKQHLTEVTYDPKKQDLAVHYTPRPKQVIILPRPIRPEPEQVIQRISPTQKTVTITQSQEIEVKPLSQPKFHSTYKSTPIYASATPQTIVDDYREDDYLANDSGSIDGDFNNILDGVSLSKALPEKITPENLGSSIKALSKLLRILQKAHALPNSAKEIVTTFPRPVEPGYSVKAKKIPHKKPYNDDEGGTPGKPGIDYPVYDEIPTTRFSCKEQRYKGFFGDPETGCQVWHYCDLNGGQASFLCPNGTIFSQVALTCDWWFNVKCDSTAQLYVLNERLYKYILPQKPSFPEDFAGPLVDHYLTQKFRELEQNRTLDASKESSESETEKEEKIYDDSEPYSLDDVESENKVRSILL